MKVELELPDWAGRSNLWLLCETEPVAYKLKDSHWMVKTSQCRMDGRCCIDHSSAFPFETVGGQCIYLRKEAGNNNQWRCGLGLFRPLQCCVGAGDKNCSVKYEEA